MKEEMSECDIDYIHQIAFTTTISPNQHIELFVRIIGYRIPKTSNVLNCNTIYFHHSSKQKFSEIIFETLFTLTHSLITSMIKGIILKNLSEGPDTGDRFCDEINNLSCL